MNYLYKTNSPIGLLTLGSDGENLTGLWIEGQKYYCAALKTGKNEICETKNLPVFTKAEKWLKNYFAGNNPAVDFPLAPSGSAFRKEVWDILCKIPYGKTVTYGGIAKLIAKKHGKINFSAQAVGGAVGHNPISIIIPCHRVVGSNGSLTGYAGGIKIKAQLLELENVCQDGLFAPEKGTAL